MRRILYIAKKEVLLILRDRMSMIILILLPLIITGILGNVLRFRLQEVGFAVFDRSGTGQMIQIISDLDASEEFSFAGNILSEEETHNAFVYKDVKFVIYVPEDLVRGGVVQIFLDGSDLIMSEAITQNLSARFAGGGYPFEISLMYNEELKSEMETLPGLVMIALIIVSSIMLGLSINRERERGTARMLMLTPAGINEIISGKGLPYLAVSLIHGISVYSLTIIMFGMEFGRGIFSFLLLTGLFSLNSMVIGVFIASLVKTELELLIGCWFFLFIPNVFFSGFIFPLQSMSVVIQPLASVMPGTLFIDSYRAIVFKEAPLFINITSFTLLVIQTITFYFVSIILFNRNFFRK